VRVLPGVVRCTETHSTGTVCFVVVVVIIIIIIIIISGNFQVIKSRMMIGLCM